MHACVIVALYVSAKCKMLASISSCHSGKMNSRRGSSVGSCIERWGQAPVVQLWKARQGAGQSNRPACGDGRCDFCLGWSTRRRSARTVKPWASRSAVRPSTLLYDDVTTIVNWGKTTLVNRHVRSPRVLAVECIHVIRFGHTCIERQTAAIPVCNLLQATWLSPNESSKLTLMKFLYSWPHYREGWCVTVDHHESFLWT